MVDSNRGKGSAAVDWAFPLTGIILALGLAIGLGWLTGLESERRYQSPHRHAERAKADAQRACSGTEAPAVFECVYDKVEASEETARSEQDLSAQQRAASSALVAAIVSFVTLIVTGIGVWFVKQTLDATLKAVEDTSAATVEMQKANVIAERNARRQMRPYLFVSKAWFKVDSKSEPTAFVEVKNFGQTPAIDKQSWIHTWVECYPLHDPLPVPPVDFQMGRTVVGPGATSEWTHPRGQPLNEISLAEIEAGRAAFYVYGKVVYRDIFGVEHWSEYTLFASGKGALKRGRLQPYVNGNVIDRNT